MKNRIALFLAAAMASMCVQAATWTDTDTGYTWTYRISGDAIVIGGDLNKGSPVGPTAISPEPVGVLTIPATLGGKKVTRIGDYAFYNCSGLTSVTIPDSVTSIGSVAFCGCSGLTSMTIPGRVTSIGEGTFFGCSGLTSMTIPDSVTSIGGRVFDGTPFFNNQPDGLVVFGKIAYKMKGVCPASVVIPDGVTSIRSSAFSGCSGLTSVTIPDSVTSIGASAFYGCSGLTSVTIPDSVTSIGELAFESCFGLTSVTIPDSVTSIGEWAFSYCETLENLLIPSSVTNIGQYAFEKCDNLKCLILPNWCRTINVYYDTDAYDKGFILSREPIALKGGGSQIGFVYYVFGDSGHVDYDDFAAISLYNKMTEECILMRTMIVYRDVGSRTPLSQIIKTELSNGYTWTYSTDGETAKVEGISPQPVGVVTVPATLGGLPVVGIADRAFRDCDALEGITMPDSVTDVRIGAFNGCGKLLSSWCRLMANASTAGGFGSVSTTIVQQVEAPYALTDHAADRAIASVTVNGDCAIDEFVLKDGKVYDSMLRIVNTADHEVRLTLPSGYVYETFEGVDPLTIPANSRNMLSITRTADNTFLVSREKLKTIQ